MNAGQRRLPQRVGGKRYGVLAQPSLERDLFRFETGGAFARVLDRALQIHQRRTILTLKRCRGP